MPIVAQGAVLDPPFRLDARNGSGQSVDPTNVTLTLKDSLGATVSGFPVTYNPGAIVKDSIGHYHYDWTVPVGFPLGTYTAQWDAILLGAPESAFETYEVVAAGSLTTGPLDFFYNPDDYEAVRNLLGVTTLDVENSDIDSLPFAPHAELDVKRRISNWTTQMLDPDLLIILRLATVYRTACLMAESFVHGGTIGLVRPLAVGEGRDWKSHAETLCAQYEYWVTVADNSDSDGEDGSIFDIHPLRVGGPTRVFLARRARFGTFDNGMPIPSWVRHPPFWPEN